MREIKFRAWHDGLMYVVFRMDLEDMGGLYIHMVNKDEKMLYHTRSLNLIKLMQFTGLHDKNGKEIYEGDIVTVDDGMMYSKQARSMVAGKYQVYWDDDQWGLNDQNGGSYDNGDYYRGDAIDWHEVTVIGNIYENPDLLKD